MQQARLACVELGRDRILARRGDAANDARDPRFNRRRLNQGSGFRKVLGDHRCSQFKQLHGLFALLQPDFLKLLSQHVLEKLKALPKRKITRGFLLLPEIVSNRFMERLAQRGRGRRGWAPSAFDVRRLWMRERPVVRCRRRTRSEERRVGKECRSRWSPYH